MVLSPAQVSALPFSPRLRMLVLSGDYVLTYEKSPEEALLRVLKGCPSLQTIAADATNLVSETVLSLLAPHLSTLQVRSFFLILFSLILIRVLF